MTSEDRRRRWAGQQRANGRCPRCGTPVRRFVQCRACRLKGAQRMAGRYQKRGGWGGVRIGAHRP